MMQGFTVKSLLASMLRSSQTDDLMGIRHSAATTAKVAKQTKKGAIVKHVKAGLLDVAYLESGPPDGSPVILLHGFPYDVHAMMNRPNG